jgi:hypothetical protein
MRKFRSRYVDVVPGDVIVLGVKCYSHDDRTGRWMGHCAIVDRLIDVGKRHPAGVWMIWPDGIRSYYTWNEMQRQFVTGNMIRFSSVR